MSRFLARILRLLSRRRLRTGQPTGAVSALAFPRDLDEAIGPGVDVWSPEAQTGIEGRLRAAAELEWATRALVQFTADPERFLRRHFELIAEHGHPELDAEWLAGFAAITDPPAQAGKEKS